MSDQVQQLSFSVLETERDLRLDQFLSKHLPGYSRSFLQRLIDDGEVRVDGIRCRRSRRMRPDEHIELRLPQPKSYDAEAEDIPLEVVYQDADIAIVNKPVGMVVHPTTHDHSGTLVNALLHHIKDLSGINGVERPGIVHRLDKDTSGLLVVAKHDRAHNHLGEQFRAHSVDRVYAALCWGMPSPDEGTVVSSLGRHPKDRRKQATVPRRGKFAVTHYRVLERYGPCSLIECSLETGRTHQIRVHLAERHHPLVGDPVYGGTHKRDIPGEPKLQTLLRPIQGQMLHAATLGFVHPTQDTYVCFRCTPPESMLGVVRALRSHRGMDPEAAGPWDRDPSRGFLGPGHDTKIDWPESTG